MENLIYNSILKSRGGHYVHALEVDSVYEIESVIEEIASEFSDYGIEALKEFFNTISIYYIGDDAETETEVYDFNTNEYIDNNF